jgi:hypothetical protein
MFKSIRALFILLAVVLSSCKDSGDIKQDCDFEKAFISLDYLRQVHKIDDNDTLKEIFPDLPSISYYDLLSFSQIDSLREFICRNKLAGLDGVIPLKFVFNNDTINISAFHISCECCSDYFISNRISVILSNEEIIIRKNSMSIAFANDSLKNTLKKIFCEKFDSFFSKQYNFKKMDIDTNIRRAYSRGPKRPGFFIYFELQNDEQWKNVEQPLNLILSSYLSALNESMKQNYKKEICELSPFELRLFSGALFLDFEFNESVQVN